MHAIRPAPAILLAGALVGSVLVAGASDVRGADNPATQNLIHRCTVTPAVTAANITQSGVPGVVPGETVAFSNEIDVEEGTIFQVAFTRPDGSLYIGSYLETIAQPSNLLTDLSSIAFTIDGVAQPTIPGTQPDPASFVLDTIANADGSTTWRMYFPGDVSAQTSEQSGHGEPSYTVPAGGQTLALNYTATVPADAVWGSVELGSECFIALNDDASNRTTERVTTAVAPILPEVAIAKTTPDVSNVYSGGATVPYTITVAVPLVDAASQTLTVAAARDVVVRDTVPAELSPLGPDGQPAVDGGQVGTNGVWDATARTITFTVGDVLPGTDAVLDYEAALDPTTPEDTVIENTAASSFSSMTGDVPGEFVETDGPRSTTDIVTASPPPTIDKIETEGTTADGQVGAGKPIDFTVTVTIPDNATYENFTIIDELPDGLDFVQYVSAVCEPAGVGCPDPITLLAEHERTDGITIIGWYLGAVERGPARTVTVNYQAQIASTYSDGAVTVFGDIFNNVVDVHWNVVDRIGSAVPSTELLPDFDGTVSADETVAFHRPVLTVAKDADRAPAWDYIDGEIAKYTVVITNDGSIDAIDIAIADVATNVDVEEATVLIDGVAGNLTDSIPGPLAPGESITITYDAIPGNSGSMTNTFGVPSYTDPGGSTYTENPRDTVNIRIEEPRLTLAKTTVGGPFSVDEETPITFTYRVTNVSSTTAFNPTVTDTPPPGAWLTYVDGSNSAAVTQTAANAWALNQASLAPGQSVTFTAQYLITGDVEPGSYTNTADLFWEDVNDGFNAAGARYTARSTSPVRLIQPDVTIVKTPDDEDDASVRQDDAVPDAPERTGEWRFRITNNSTFPSYNIIVNDPMPDTFEIEPGQATVAWSDPSSEFTFTETSAADGLTEYPDHTRTFSGVISRLDPLESITITLPFKQNGNIPGDLNFEQINTASISNPNWRPEPGHFDDGAYEIVPLEPSPRIVKSLTPASGGIGTEVTWILDVELQGADNGNVLHDVLITDDVPDGFTITNEPAIDTAATAATDWSENGWSATCVSGDCASVEFIAGYLGSEDLGGGETRLNWFIGEYTSPNPLNNAVIRIEFTATLDAVYDDGTGVADGSRDPVPNHAQPYHNRDTAYSGGDPSGDVIAGFPPSAPAPTALDQRGTRVRAEFDIVSPRLDLDKQAYAGGRKLTDDGVQVGGEPAGQVHAGQQIDYVLSVTAAGSGPSYNIIIEDDLADGRLRLDASSINVTPAGATCLVGVGPQLTCTFAGPLALGQQMVVTYSGLPPLAADMAPAGSSENVDPDLIENAVEVVQYQGTAIPGPDDPTYTVGEAVMKTYVYTPQAEIEITLGPNSVCRPEVGDPVEYLVSIGSGDVGNEFDGQMDNPPNEEVRSLTPYPVTPGVATGFDPTVTVTIAQSLEINIAGITATGFLVGETDGTFVPFRAPDSITTDADGNQVLTWTGLDDMPHSADLTEGQEFQAALEIAIPTTSTGVAPVTATADVAFHDGQGTIERGTGATNLPYTESDAVRCGRGVGGGPGGGVGGGVGNTLEMTKTPDQDQRVSILPGGTGEFTVTIETDHDNLTNIDMTDTMPDGLIYLGRDPGDPDYAVATISPALPGGATLESYFQGAVPVGTSERLSWGTIPTMPGGTITITIPVRGEDPPPFPTQFLTNRFDLSTSQGDRSDTGDMFSEDIGAPVITKSIGDEQVGPGDTVPYTIEVLIPSDFEDTNVTVFDYLNNQQNTNRAGYPTGDPYPRSNNGQQFDMEANLELVGYVSATCVSGCSGGANNIVPQPLTQVPLVDPTADPAANAGDAGGFGWFLGDILADPEGQNRLLRFVVDVQVPTIAEMQTHMNQFSAGTGDQMVAGAAQYSQVDYRNLATLGTAPDGSAWDTDPNVLTDPDVWRAAGQETVIDDDIADLSWYVPAVSMTKECHSTTLGDDHTGIWDVESTPVGTPNVECVITLTNPSQSTAYNVPVNDFETSSRLQSVPTGQTSTVSTQGGSTTTTVPWSTALAATTNNQHLTSVDGAFPMDWVVPSIGPGETVELAYEVRLDGWAEPGIGESAQTIRWARWYNTATRQEFTAEPDAASDRLGGTQLGRDEFRFAAPQLNISKAPITPPGQARESTAPYPGAGARLEDPLLPPSTKIQGQFASVYGLPTLQSVMANHIGLKPNCNGSWQQNGGDCNIGNISNANAYGEDLVARVGETTTWAIGVWISSPERYNAIEITDTLPYGFDYVEGSGKLVDAAGWTVHNQPSQGAPRYDLHTLSAETEVGLVPGTATACNAATIHDGGHEVTWRFDQSNPNTRQFWDTSYFDARVPPMYAGAPHYKVLIYETIATNAVAGCDPNTQAAGRFLMENNVRLNALRAGEDDLIRTASMLVPVDSPVSLEKSPDGGFFPDDATTDFTITFSNHGTKELLNKVLDDTIFASNGPTVMPYVCGTASAVIIDEDGDERVLGASEFTEPTCTVTQPTTAVLQHQVARLGPGETLVISIPMPVPNDEPNGVRYDNTVAVDVTPEYGRTLSETGDGTVVNPSPPPAPVKAAGNPTPTINDTFDYTIDVSLPAGQVWLDLAYYDLVPDGYTFNGYGEVTCSGATCNAFRASLVKPLTAVNNGDGTTSLGWWFGDVVGTNGARTYRFTYSVTVEDAYEDGGKVVAGDLLTNVVDGFSNDRDQFDDPPPTAVTDTSTYDYTVETIDVVEVQEPHIVVEKSAAVVGGSAVASGTDQLQYTVVVTNDGGIPAYDLRVSDTPGAALENVVVDPTPAGSFLVDGWTIDDPEVQFYIPMLAAGASLTFTYTADVVDDYATIPATTADNIVEPRTYRSSPTLQPKPDDRIYDDNPPTTTRTRLVSPNIGIEKYADAACGIEVAAAKIGESVTWCLVVTNSGEISAFNPVVRDALPLNWSYQVASSRIDGTPVEPNQTTSLGIEVLTWPIPNLGPGASTTITFEAAPARGATLEATNVASVRSTDANGNTPPDTVPGFRDSDTAMATLPQHSVEIAKTEDVQMLPFAGVGGEFVWTLTIGNPLATDLTDVRVVEHLPPPLIYTPGTATSPILGFVEESVSVGGGPGGTTEVVWTVPFLAGNDSFAINFPVAAPPGVVEDVVYVNDAQVSAAEVTDIAVDQAKVSFFQPASVGNFVWKDLDADGVQGAGEPGVDGVVVNLLDADGNQLYLHPITGPTTDPSAGPPITTITGDDPNTPGTQTGFYEFTNLPSGDYVVEFEPPEGTVLTNPNQGGSDGRDSDVDPTTNRVAVNLDPGENDLTIDAGLIDEADLASLGDFVWLDTDADGVQGTDEDGLNGVTVELMRPGPDGIFGTVDDQVLATTTTTADPNNPGNDGWYEFDRLPPTDYQVRFTPPPDLAFTTANSGNDGADSDADRVTGLSPVVKLEPGQHDATIDAGLVEAINSIEGVVWDDRDRDGINDQNEPPVNGVTVELIGPGPDGILGTADDVVLGTTTTGTDPNDPNVDGFYEFTGLPDGVYATRFVEPPGKDLTLRNVGDDRTDSDADRTTGLSGPIDLDSDRNNPTPEVGIRDAGLVDVVNSVRGVVWDDVDRDGVRDPSEPPVNGVTVELLTAGPDGVFGTADDVVRSRTTTGTDPNDTKVKGFYEFPGLPDGKYQLRFVVPDGMVLTLPNVGGDDTDSDANPSTRRSGVVDLDSAGVIGVPVEDVIDAGLRQLDPTDLTIVKAVTDGFENAADTADWTISITNEGEVPDPGPVTVTDPLPAGLGFVSAKGDGWSCAHDSGTVTCIRAGQFAAGATASFVITTRATDSTGATVINTATVRSTVTEELSTNNEGLASTVLPSRPEVVALPDTGSNSVRQSLAMGFVLIALGAVALASRRRRLQLSSGTLP